LKYTLLVTQRCNLACDYCYVAKHPSRMPLEVARRVIGFAFRRTPPDEKIEIGFFGGEPLLELDRVREITALIEAHPSFARERVPLTVISNGTVYTDAVADFLARHEVAFGISCDGPPAVHDRHRRSKNGNGSGRRVERTLRRALEAFPRLMVNAVYGPDTLPLLPEAVEYFSSLGLRRIYLSPDFSAPWTAADAARLAEVYGAVAALFRRYYLRGDPHFVSLIDGKIAAILRGGYQPLERCRMGHGELAFTPDGGVYPCERLVGDGGEEHRIGSVFEGLRVERLLCHRAAEDDLLPECAGCGLRDVCMHWCGCSNYFSTGRYDRVGPFLCASEQAAIRAAFTTFEALEADGIPLCDHLGRPPEVPS
jgi:uncharacterized protein